MYQLPITLRRSEPKIAKLPGFFFFNDPAATDIDPLSRHDAPPSTSDALGASRDAEGAKPCGLESNPAATGHKQRRGLARRDARET